MSNFGIGIPTINRADILNPSLKRYENDLQNVPIYIVDNGKQEIYKSSVTKTATPLSNLGVAPSWNLLCEQIFDAKDYALILNDDVYLGKTEADIEAVIIAAKENGWDFIVSNGNWSAFLISKSTFLKTGGFDENFKIAYVEDNDFAQQLKTNNLHLHHSNALNPLRRGISQSIAKDPSLNRFYHSNWEYYYKKWGGKGTNYLHKLPFNGVPQKGWDVRCVTRNINLKFA